MSCIDALRFFFFSACLACTSPAGLASMHRWTVFCRMLDSYILHTILGTSWRRTGVALFRFRLNSRCLRSHEARATASLSKLPSRACEHDCTEPAVILDGHDQLGMVGPPVVRRTTHAMRNVATAICSSHPRRCSGRPIRRVLQLRKVIWLTPPRGARWRC